MAHRLDPGHVRRKIRYVVVPCGSIVHATFGDRPAKLSVEPVTFRKTRNSTFNVAINHPTSNCSVFFEVVKSRFHLLFPLVCCGLD